MDYLTKSLLPYYIRRRMLTKGVRSSFPDSRLRGDAEQGDNNQVPVALVLYLSNRGNNRREAGCWLFG